MTRKTKRILSKITNLSILLVIIGIVGVFIVNTYQEYKFEKEDADLVSELEGLLGNDLMLYEEVLPEGDESSGGITVLPPSNEDLLVANVSYFGIIEIPSIGVRKPIVKGTTRKDIANKVGYDTHTAQPGASGNAVLAAHNTTNYFGKISRLKNGAEIKITTREGVFVYKVFDIFKVHKTETWIYNKVEGHEKIVTLITCVYPDNSYRWIVRGELVE